MTFLDPTSPAATAGLEPAVEDLETTDGELIGIGFESEAIGGEMEAEGLYVAC